MQKQPSMTNAALIAARCAPSDLRSSKEIEGFLKKSGRTLSRWRSLGKGPRFYRFEGSGVAYDMPDVLSYLATSKSEPGKSKSATLGQAWRGETRQIRTTLQLSA
jgi:hypothetical protein